MSTSARTGSSPAALGAPRRIVFLDALRLLAAFQMIQGHTLDAMLAPGYRSGPLFETWTYVRGLTSTAFLFAAGLSFALVTADDTRRKASRGHRLRRALKLLAIGYLLHAPFAALFGVPWSTALREASIVDVLQNIAVSLLLLEAIADFVPMRSARALVALTLALAAFLFAKASDAVVPAGPSLWIGQYLSSKSGSLFPLLPWAGYALSGYAVGLFVVPEGVRTDRALATRRLCAITLLAFLVTGLFLSVWGTASGKLAPGFTVLKLALVSAVACALAMALHRVTRLPAWLEKLASETLFLYVSHVLVLYAAVVGVKAQLGSVFSPWTAGLVALGLVVVCSACALSYGRAQEALRARRAGGREASQ